MLLANDNPSPSDAPRSELATIISCFWSGLSHATNRRDIEVTTKAIKILNQTQRLKGLTKVPISSKLRSESYKEKQSLKLKGS